MILHSGLAFRYGSFTVAYTLSHLLQILVDQELATWGRTVTISMLNAICGKQKCVLKEKKYALKIGDEFLQIISCHLSVS